MFEADFSLDDIERKTTIEPLTAMDLASSLCAMMVVLWVIGVPFRRLNALHFHAFGRFEPAELPPTFLKSLLKTAPAIETPGLKTFIRLKELRANDVPVYDPAYTKNGRKSDRVKEAMEDIKQTRNLMESEVTRRGFDLIYKN